MATERVAIGNDPGSATFLWTEERTPRVRLVANRDYWDTARGPHLQEVLFRNDLTPEAALDLICTTEGEVDVLTEIQPKDAARVEASEHVTLVAIDSVRIIAGIINRDAEELPFADARARRALNMAIDRDALVREAMFGRAKPLAGLTPPAAIPILDRVLHPLFTPYLHEPENAQRLWAEAGGTGRAIRLAAPMKLAVVAQHVAVSITTTLGIGVEVTVATDTAEEHRWRRALAERTQPKPWDILLWEQGAQAADAPPLELHRAFVHSTGEYTAGPPVPAFDALFDELKLETSKLKQAQISHRIDEFVYNEALALFLCAPQALYAVNRHVDFTPYATTLEFAQTTVGPDHWSRRGR